MKAGFRLLRDVEEQSRFLLLSDEEIVYDDAAVEKVLRKNDGQGMNTLRDLRGLLAGIVPWSAPALEAAVEKFCQERALKLNNAAQPLRVAISGTTISPPIFQSLEFLGRERTLARVDRTLA